MLLPPSALEKLVNSTLQHPWMFSIQGTGKATNPVTHGGVLEFTAEEGKAYLPSWMMRTLLLREGDTASFQSVTLPPATYAKFEPQNVDFLEISDPRAVLEYSLRSFSCLSQGDVFAIHYVGKSFEIRVVELKPKSAVSIYECNVQLDFAPPVGYVEPDYRKLAEEAKSKAVLVPSASNPMIAPSGASPLNILGSTPTQTKFGGTGFRIDGKPIKNSPSVGSMSNEGALSRSFGSSQVLRHPSALSTVANAGSVQSVMSSLADPNIFVPGRLRFWRPNPTAVDDDDQGLVLKPGFQSFTGVGNALKSKRS